MARFKLRLLVRHAQPSPEPTSGTHRSHPQVFQKRVLLPISVETVQLGEASLANLSLIFILELCDSNRARGSPKHRKVLIDFVSACNLTCVKGPTWSSMMCFWSYWGELRRLRLNLIRLLKSDPVLWQERIEQRMETVKRKYRLRRFEFSFAKLDAVFQGYNL